MSLDALALFLNKRPGVIPRYVEGIKAAGLNHLTAPRLVENVLTRTLRASETPFEGDPEGRGLTYGPGHTPLGQAERDAVLAAAGPWGTVGVANDAHGREGFAYGLIIENKTETHAKAAAELPGVMAAAAPAAWAAAIQEAT